MAKKSNIRLKNENNLRLYLQHNNGYMNKTATIYFKQKNKW